MSNHQQHGIPVKGTIRLVNARVRGRLRVEVPELYRSSELKLELQQILLAQEGVRSVTANVRTGRLLIIYGTELSVESLLAILGRALGDSYCTPVTIAGPAAKPKPVARPLQGAIRRLMSSASSMFDAPPLAAATATAGFEATDSLLPQSQEVAPWHEMDAPLVMAKLRVSPSSGLDLADAVARLAQYGKNRLAGSEPRSDLSIFIGQFNSLPVALLGVSALVSVATGGVLDAAVIAGVVVINSIIGFVTERQAEKTISSLAESGVKTVNVLRGETAAEISVEDIVPGDILLFTPGTYVAADVRLVESHRLSIDESALTGESLPVAKNHAFISSGETALGDRINMGYMGTHVTGGAGRGVVVATSEVTELGQIQTMVGEAEAPETPMQKQLDQMGTQLALLCGAVCAGVFAVGLLRGYSWLEMLKSSVSLAVAAVPEGLPAVATTTLAMGIAEMKKRNVAVRHLDAVEGLGSVQIFCLDKTGTLTVNRMTVVDVYCGQRAYSFTGGKLLADDGSEVDASTDAAMLPLMQVVTLCSETTISGSPQSPELDGSPTEKALIELAINGGVDVVTLLDQQPRLQTRYRAEGRPFMSTLHPTGSGSYLLAVKGSPDAVLALCNHQFKGGKKVRLTQAGRDEILAQNTRMAGDALRVLGVAFRETDDDQMPKQTSGLVWLGLAGMADPMRPEMDALMAEFHTAGIETVMITGDQRETANAIGKQLKLNRDKPIKVLESSALEDMDPDLLAGLAKDVNVFARVSPAHKLKIVRALQEAGNVVAMTGDGINDGPALKAADIGVAMGGSGTNTARDVSDVVLEDDNLHTMASAVRHGRTIYNNIRKTIHFMVSTNLTEIEIMLAGIAFGLGQPLNPMQLLWINLVTDIFPGLALSLEPAEPDIMERPPRDASQSIIDGRNLKRMTFESGVIGVGTMGAFLYGVRRYGPGAAASTLAFNALTFNELAHAASARSPYRNVFGGQSLQPNKHLTAAIGGMAAAQVVVSVVPGFRRLLGTAPMSAGDLLVLAVSVLGPLVINEWTKPAAPVRIEKHVDSIATDDEETNIDQRGE